MAINGSNGRTPPEIVQAQKLEQAAKAVWKVADDKVSDIQQRIARADVAIVNANANLLKAQRALADDAVRIAAQDECARAAFVRSGLSQRLTEAEAEATPLYAIYDQASAKLSGLLQDEEVKHADAELIAAQQVEAEIIAALNQAQHARAAAWNRAHDLHVKRSNARYREQQARMRAEKRPVPGFERTRNAQL
jgi:hypothetical protein